MEGQNRRKVRKRTENKRDAWGRGSARGARERNGHREQTGREGRAEAGERVEGVEKRERSGVEGQHNLVYANNLPSDQPDDRAVGELSQPRLLPREDSARYPITSCFWEREMEFLGKKAKT